MVGIDDIPQPSNSLPRLTTVAAQAADGREVAELLLRSVRSGKQPPPDLLLLSPDLVVRASTDPLDRHTTAFASAPLSTSPAHRQGFHPGHA